jgi:hypothetical protein
VQTDKDREKLRGPAVLILDADDSSCINASSYYVAADGDKAVLQPGYEVQAPLARVLLICMPPRQTALVPDAFDV